MRLTTANSRIPYENLHSECLPTRTKFGITFEAGNGRYEVALLIPLDNNYPDEAKARGLFVGDVGSLEVAYEVNIDFAAQREKFSKLLRDIYAGPVGEILRQDSLVRVDELELRAVLNPLVREGMNVFQRLFLDPDVRYKGYQDDDRDILYSALKSAFSHGQVFSISNTGPLFPWAFLYYDEDFDPTRRSTIKLERFWGFMHEIQEELNDAKQRILLPANPRIFTAICPRVDEQGWHKADDHPFSKVETETTPSIFDLRTKLTDFKSDCLYFFGHAHHEEPATQITSWLKLTEKELTIDMLVSKQAPKFKTSPVVAFLNGCRTSPLTSWNEETVVGFFCFRGGSRLCCVASVGEVPASFAAEFAKIFWDKFLITRLPIGTALRMARTHMLVEWNNPLGLLYSLFGRVDTHIALTEEASNGQRAAGQTEVREGVKPGGTTY